MRASGRRGRLLVVAGVALLVAGLGLGGWLGWQLWGTTWVAERRHADLTAELERGWGDGRDAVETEHGTATAVLRVPRFGADFAVPVLEGDSDEVLASGVGHLSGTAAAGQPGNYVVAGHRVTHGEPFARLRDLRAGDEVHVATREATWVYRLDTDGGALVVPFTADWVLAPRPTHPDGGVQPPADAPDQLITLVTCSEIFHTDDRDVVFGHLVDRLPSAG
ncbi:class E sortase [Nocardioides sp. SYSU D00038]|uniref:class E sortase n=1 Tax=Nocardioides sp. SYSU D00038 TaxID=2812554 RepID=UPI0027DD186C|nr:class E sortase [Nocardioides sp. SYSU D00038]